jgi:hypothetical protein
MPSRPTVIRNAVAGDMPELRRLFYAMMAESGMDDFNITKVQSAFERGIKRDGAMLLVATGKPGRLVGFLLFEPIAPWFSDERRVTETCIFVEPGHRRSVGARKLRKFAEERRKESDKRKAEAVPAAPNVPSKAQNGAAAASQPIVAGASDRPDSKPVDGVDALLKTLASRNRPESVASGGSEKISAAGNKAEGASAATLPEHRHTLSEVAALPR